MDAVTVVERAARLLLRMALALVPPDERDCVNGDLNEEFGTAFTAKARAAVTIGLKYQIEPYRNTDHLSAMMLTALVGVGLLWLVPIASSQMFVLPELLDYPPIEVAAVIWNASHVTSSIAAGLFVGRSSLTAPLESAVRWHVGILLSVGVVLLSTGIAGACLAVTALLTSLWVGNQNRQLAVEPENASH